LDESCNTFIDPHGEIGFSRRHCCGRSLDFERRFNSGWMTADSVADSATVELNDHLGGRASAMCIVANRQAAILSKRQQAVVSK
jgi:hypothetical protein